MEDLGEHLPKNTTPQQTNTINKYNCIKCNFITSNKKDYSRHLLTKRHIKNDKLHKNENLEEIPSKISTPNTPKQYICKLCNFETFYKTDYTCHLSTNKHKKNSINKEADKNENIVLEIKQPKIYNCETCNYITKDLSRYTRHCNTIKHFLLINMNEFILKNIRIENKI